MTRNIERSRFASLCRITFRNECQDLDDHNVLIKGSLVATFKNAVSPV